MFRRRADSQTIGTSTATSGRNRHISNVGISALSAPSLAPMKPELQHATNRTDKVAVTADLEVTIRGIPICLLMSPTIQIGILLSMAEEFTPELTPKARRILESASKLFYEKGIHAVGVDTVALDAGVTKKSLYERVGSIDGLVVEYLKGRDRRWRSFGVG